MKIVILGATGRTGLPLLKRALDAGYSVTVLVRNPGKLQVTHDNLSVVQGDLTDYASVAKALKGSEAVLSAAGPVKGSDPSFLVAAAKNVIRGMNDSGIRRLIWLTGAGVVDARDEKDFTRPLIRGIMKLFAGKVLSNSEKAYKLIIDSNLDYTVVRVPVLSEAPGGGSLKAGYAPPKPKPVSRENLAEYMLDCLTGNKQVRESPMLGY